MLVAEAIARYYIADQAKSTAAIGQVEVVSKVGYSTQAEASFFKKDSNNLDWVDQHKIFSIDYSNYQNYGEDLKACLVLKPMVDVEQ